MQAKGAIFLVFVVLASLASGYWMGIAPECSLCRNFQTFPAGTH